MDWIAAIAAVVLFGLVGLLWYVHPSPAMWLLGSVVWAIAIAAAFGLLFTLKARGLEEKPFARNWMALVSVTMAIMLLFVGGSPP